MNHTEDCECVSCYEHAWSARQDAEEEEWQETQRQRRTWEVEHEMAEVDAINHYLNIN